MDVNKRGRWAVLARGEDKMPEDRPEGRNVGRVARRLADWGPGLAVLIGLAGAPFLVALMPVPAHAAEATTKPVAKPAANPVKKATTKPATAPHEPFGGFATDPDQPIEIEADTLEVEDKRQTATFIGNVVATQGTTKLRADRLQASYAPDASGERTQVREIYATGKVHVLSKDDQSADGDWARYTVADRHIVMGDNVVLRQATNVIRGTKLFIDLNTGRSRVIGGAEATKGEKGATGRVKALFQPPPKAKK